MPANQLPPIKVAPTTLPNKALEHFHIASKSTSDTVRPVDHSIHPQVFRSIGSPDPSSTESSSSSSSSSSRDLAAEVVANTPPLDEWRKFIYCHSMLGEALGEVDHFRGGRGWQCCANAWQCHVERIAWIVEYEIQMVADSTSSSPDFLQARAALFPPPSRRSLLPTSPSTASCRCSSSARAHEAAGRVSCLGTLCRGWWSLGRGSP